MSSYNAWDKQVMPDLNEWNQTIIDEFRSNDGVVGGIFEGAPLLLLHNRGAKSGIARVNPLMYRPEGDDVVVFASNEGAPTNPAWLHNVIANPGVSVERDGARYEATAVVLEVDRRDPIWEAQKADAPAFAAFEATAEGRQIPVVLLRRSES